MSSKKRFSSFALLGLAAILLLLSFSLPGCSGTEPAENSKTPANSEADTSPDTLLSYLPDTRYNEDFLIVTYTGVENEFYVEDSTGDRVDYAIYLRNSTIEEKYGVTIKYKTYDYQVVPQYVADFVKSGDPKGMDLVNSHIAFTANIPISGDALNWYDVPNVDLTSDWWARSTVEDLTLNDICYIAVGDFNTSAIRFTYCMFYNKVLCDKYNLPDIYKLTMVDQKWTYSEMMTVITDIHEDLNQDNTMNQNDLYGLITAGWSAANNYIWAFDNPIFKKNSDTGELEFTFYTDKIESICEKLVRKLYYRNDSVYKASAVGMAAQLFSEGQAVFANAFIGAAQDYLREMNSESWGICPYPKYNSKQEKYLTSVDGCHTAQVCPRIHSEKKLEKIGVITEALNCLSHYGLKTEYLDKGLKSKYINDPHEAEVIDLLLENRVFDFGYVYIRDFKSPAFWIQEMVEGKNPSMASTYAAKKDELEKALEDTFSAFQLDFPGLAK